MNLPVKGVGGNFIGRELDSGLLVGGNFSVDLDAEATSGTDFSRWNLWPPKMRFLGTHAVCVLPKFP